MVLTFCPLGNTTASDEAWRNREGRVKRYQGKRVGGTTIVHSIKKHMWFLEAAYALLEGEDYTEAELAHMAQTSSSALRRQDAYWAKTNRGVHNFVLSRDRLPAQ